MAPYGRMFTMFALPALALLRLQQAGTTLLAALAFLAGCTSTGQVDPGIAASPSGKSLIVIGINSPNYRIYAHTGEITKEGTLVAGGFCPLQSPAPREKVTWWRRPNQATSWGSP